MSLRLRSALAPAVVAGLALVAACSGGSTEPLATDGARRTLEVTSLLTLDAKGTQMSGVEQAGVRVIRSEGEWNAAWGALHGGVTPAPARPGVDFTRQTVVLVAMGTRPSGGYTVRVDSAWQQGGRALVAVTYRSPGPSCFTAAVLTAPLALAVVNAAGLDFQVVPREETVGCS